MILLACGKDNILRHQSVLHNGELRKLNPFHTSDCIIPTSPVELYVVSCVAICRQSRKVSEKKQWTGMSFKPAYMVCHLWQ